MASQDYRSLARERAVQFLFGLEFTNYAPESAWLDFWESYESRRNVREYAEGLVSGVLSHQGELDGTLIPALKNWTIERLGRVERSILRVGLYEMAHGGVPPKVAINEAVELAKAYGSEDSPGFVNAVLDRLKDGVAGS